MSRCAGVSPVVPPGQRGRCGLCRLVAPLALAASKRLLWDALGVERALPEEARMQCVLAATADAREGLAAVIAKRKPVFQGR